MNENGETLPPPDDDRTPTQEDAPSAKGREGWEMPQPVFRQSSGYLPKGVVERYQQAQQASVDTEPGTVESGESTVGAEIPAQPETVAATPAPVAQDEVASPAPKKKSKFLRIVLITLGLILAAADVAAIVAAVVIWYFFQTNESQTFN